MYNINDFCETLLFSGGIFDVIWNWEMIKVRSAIFSVNWLEILRWISWTAGVLHPS